jgi:hypothetical protein
LRPLRRCFFSRKQGRCYSSCCNLSTMGLYTLARYSGAYVRPLQPPAYTQKQRTPQATIFLRLYFPNGLSMDHNLGILDYGYWFRLRLSSHLLVTSFYNHSFKSYF